MGVVRFLVGRRLRLVAVLASAVAVTSQACLMQAAVAVGVAIHIQSAGAGAQLWLRNYQPPGTVSDNAVSVAVGPHGSTSYVTGALFTAAGVATYGTVAYRITTGTRLWASQYDGGNAFSFAHSLAVSPDGSEIFVTGESGGQAAGTDADYATVAYDAMTGRQLWATTYDGPGHGNDRAWSVSVAPDGTKVFVTGGSPGTGSGNDYATVAYNAVSGAQLWARRYNGPGNGSDSAVSAAVSPDGSRVFVAGGSTGAGSGFDYTTIAYRAATGATAWARRYNGPASRKDYAHWIAVSRNGRMVFVTGATRARPSGVDYGTIAYNARTGARLWLARYNGPGNNTDDALSVAADPGGRRVYVTGYSRGARSGQDYGTIAYNAATGARLWTARYDGPLHHNDEALAMTVGPDGHEVFVTGRSENAQFHYVTVAYRATTGGRVWATDSGLGTPGAIAIGPAGHTIVVTGSGQTSYLTVAYRN